MKKVLVDSSEFYTSVGVFKRETILYEVDSSHNSVEERRYFNGVEYSDANYVKNIIGEDGWATLKNEVEKYSNVLDAYISVSAK